jgi:Ala-tRNA(Pro) deacylase
MRLCTQARRQYFVHLPVFAAEFPRRTRGALLAVSRGGGFNMALVDRWLEYLNSMGVRYSHSTHPRAETALRTADAERMPARDLAKTVVYHGDAGFGIAVVPADQFVNLGKLQNYLGLSFLRLATEEELARLFPNCELGAMPPFGDYCDMPVIVDIGIAGDFIAFAMGTHRDIVRVSFADFLRLANPAIASIATGMEVLV